MRTAAGPCPARLGENAVWSSIAGFDLKPQFCSGPFPSARSLDRSLLDVWAALRPAPAFLCGGIFCSYLLMRLVLRLNRFFASRAFVCPRVPA